ncbi:MAG: penicillin-binding protein 2 [Gemmatimonadota bacterium]|nr:penicillin-binding protein 2 [Gemmatimonadota bacterium]
MSWGDRRAVARRADLGRVMVIATFTLLTVAFFRLQVIGSDRYRVQSEENRLRPVPIPAPRGLITDRHGVVLAENVPGYSVSLHAVSAQSLRTTLDRLNPILRTDSVERALILERYRLTPSEPVLVRRNATFEVVSALEELRPWNPGLVIQSDPKRRYPFSATTAHLVGYVGEVSEEELRVSSHPGARLGTLVGRDGLEQFYDAELRGRDGVKYVEVDALNRTIRDAGIESTLEPQPGRTIRTTIDLELQRFVESTFPPGRRGAVIAMDPRSGEVLALYSAPSFDSNVLVGGVDPTEWQRLAASQDFPLFNRAIQARYPPASPFKLAIAAMALRRGIVTFDTRMTVPCRGGFQYYNRYFRCWRVEGHGNVNLAEAIQYSCDVYFYQLGLKLGLTGLLQDGTALGFGSRSGIDLPSETESIFPGSAEYYNRRYGPRNWTSAVTLNLAIGQGENAQTLVNVVRFYGMLASPHGTTAAPHLVATRQGQQHTLGLSDRDLADLRASLVAVVDRGTAAAAQIMDLRIAGKTGTAQNPHGPDHGWFVAFAPADDPEIVVGTIVEFAEHGSRVAPVVTRIIARYLLGADAVKPRGGEYRLETPADSAPQPIPILPDTALLRGPGREPVDRAR